MGRRRKRAQPRSKKPTDWLVFLEPLVAEMDAALEILRRLRWAVELSNRGLSIAPGPEPGSTKVYEPRIANGLVENVLTPEEMVEELSARDLRQLRDEWESEVREWGEGIWKQRGDVLRLRKRRHDYARDIELLKNAPPLEDSGISKVAAARLVNDSRAAPGKFVKPKKTDGAVMEAHVFTDPFGNLLPPDEEERLLEVTEQERAEPLENDRSLRRIIDGEHKKSLGGVHDLDPRLLRRKK